MNASKDIGSVDRLRATETGEIPSMESAAVRTPPPLGEPPNFGQWMLPHFATFSAQYNQFNRTHRWTHDEALMQGRELAVAMFRDPLIYACLRARQLPVSQYPWHLEPHEEGDRAMIEQVASLTSIIRNMPDFYGMKLSLLESIYFGRAAVQTKFGNVAGKRRAWLVPQAHLPINGDKLVFRWNGEVGIRVGTSFYKGSASPNDLSMVHFLTPYERECLTICKFEPTDMDFFEGQLSGSVNGYGLRGRLFVYWYIRQNVLTLLYNYLERTAAGFTIYYYEAGNPNSLAEVTDAAQTQIGQNSILFPRRKDAPNDGPGVTRLEAGPTGPTLFNQQVERMDSLIQFTILGQLLTYDTAPTGLGSNVASAHERTFDRYLRADAQMLESALNRDFVAVLSKYNYPNLPPPRLVIDIDKPNVQEIIEAANVLYQMGAPMDGDYLMSVVGLPKPEPGSFVLSPMANQGPLPPGSTPDQIPRVGYPEGVGAPGGDVPPATPPGMGGASSPKVSGNFNKYSRGGMAALDRYRRELLSKGILGKAGEFLAANGHG